MAPTDQILVEFDSGSLDFINFKDNTEQLIRSILQENRINTHKIESRVKARKSLENKIQAKNDKYESLYEITDLIGVRIITYFEDEVDRIAELIKGEFEVDDQHSIDKRIMDSDRFGYQSLHYVCRFRQERLQLLEYRNFSRLKVEIQIRSILQHAWAEIEHDIGYKSKYSIPALARRNFYRIAALLESADLEFVRLRDTINNYSENVKEEIKIAPENVALDETSLASYFEQSETVSRIDRQIAAMTQGSIVKIDFLYSRLLIVNYFGIKTVQELENSLQTHEPMIIEFAAEWLKGVTFDKFSKGISVFYLGYVLTAQQKSLIQTTDYLEKVDIDRKNGETAEKIMEAYKKITQPNT